MQHLTAGKLRRDSRGHQAVRGREHLAAALPQLLEIVPVAALKVLLEWSARDQEKVPLKRSLLLFTRVPSVYGSKTFFYLCCLRVSGALTKARAGPPLW